MIEFVLLLPWYVFLFVGVFDYCIYCCGLIAVENAARVGAAYCSTDSTDATDNSTACTYALDQLRNLPNVGSAVVSCDGSPITITASSVTGPDNVANDASKVTVTYVTPQLILPRPNDY
jgi:Flp pilus assembly protein TadG